MRQFVFLWVASVAFLAVAEKQPLSRYQSIIDRQMFGALPPGFDPTKSPSEVAKTSAASQRELTQEQEKLQSAVHFSVINVTPEGETAVGFTDNSDPKAPKHYYLKVGEERDGWLVKEADAAEASMTIAKDEIEVTLKIGDNSAKGGGTTAKAGGGVPGGRPPSFGGAPGARTLLGGGSGLASLRARRQMRQQQENAARDAAAKAAAQKEAERAEREAAEKAERDAERAQQRQQLLAIQEELRKAREEKQKKEAEEQKKAETEGDGNGANNAE